MGFLKRHIKFFILVISLAFVIGAMTGSRLNLPRLSEIINTPFEGEEIRTMVAPAVDNEGNGVPASLIVTVRSGNGKVLVNINDVLAGFDTQESAKHAARIAGEVSGINLERLDIIYSIEADAPLISGASAGAAMTISTIAALQKKDLNPTVSITGAIGENNKIVQVGGVLPKAEAVKLEGIRLFLVPSGQGYEKEYSREINCETVGSTEICRTQYVSEGVSLGEGVGIRIIEVDTIESALPYFVN